MSREKKNIVWIDVGTHIGQEILAALGPRSHIHRIFLRRFVGANFLRRGRAYKFDSLRKINVLREKIRDAGEFTTIAVEANPRLFNERVYQFVDIAFCVALGSTKNFKITKLFFFDSNVRGQGGSIFSKRTRGNSQAEYVVVTMLDASRFFESLRDYLDGKFGETQYEVILRLNCEGSEGEVIRSCHAVFGDRILIILGSLKDVLELRGDVAASELDQFLVANDLSFVSFSSLWSTWEPAMTALLACILRTTDDQKGVKTSQEANV